MEIICLFLLQVFILFVLSRFLQKYLSQFIFSITKSERITVYAMAGFFFIGTVIHEFSHLIMANLLFVHTGKMELLPKLEGNSIRLGSVEIVKPDPFRRLLIGVAPFLMGTTIIVLTLFSADFFDATHTLWIGILALLIVFQIGNTMFSSKKDMEGASFFLVLIIIIAITLYLLGFRTSLEQINGIIPSELLRLGDLGSKYLLIPIAIDVAAIALLFFGIKLIGRK
ncbi:MAG: hypothetical protein KBC15_00370 [Candidatus Levybacteria bacterium]|nr:hypothetical protein [Candidatus Levybacteria bacterium]